MKEVETLNSVVQLGTLITPPPETGSPHLENNCLWCNWLDLIPLAESELSKVDPTHPRAVSHCRYHTGLTFFFYDIYVSIHRPSLTDRTLDRERFGSFPNVTL